MCIKFITDFQSVKLCPMLKTSVDNYSMKLKLYNFTINNFSNYKSITTFSQCFFDKSKLFLKVHKSCVFTKTNIL